MADKYDIVVSEDCWAQIEIEANSVDEAKNIAKQMLIDGKIKFDEIHHYVEERDYGE